MDLAHPGIITLNRASPEPGAAYSVLPEDTRGPDPHKPISVSISQVCKIRSTTWTGVDTYSTPRGLVQVRRSPANTFLEDRQAFLSLALNDQVGQTMSAMLKRKDQEA
jgi:hypothetical protein